VVVMAVIRLEAQEAPDLHFRKDHTVAPVPPEGRAFLAALCCQLYLFLAVQSSRAVLRRRETLACLCQVALPHL